MNQPQLKPSNTSAPYDLNEVKNRLKKAHFRLLRHPETCLYGGVILMGESSVIEEDFTAYTDGKNKRYSASFLAKLTIEEVTGLALHENIHVVAKHIPRHRDLIAEDKQLANAAFDYVDNDIIMSLKDKTLCKLPEGGLYDPKFHNWSVREVYEFLKTGKHGKDQDKPNGKPEQGDDGDGDGDSAKPSTPPPKQGKPVRGEKEVEIAGESYGIESTDEHDDTALKDAQGGTPEEQRDAEKELCDEIDEAIRQGGMMAGRFGVKIPRTIAEGLLPKVDWREQTRDFVTAHIKGKDEYSWRNFNRRRVADDCFLPVVHNETIGEMIIGIDTSGSMSNSIISEVIAEVQSLADICQPDRIRVLWWDTEVHGEQMFEKDGPGGYSEMHKVMKPQGGGGTAVKCIDAYIDRKNLKADCVLILTDGYVEAQGAALGWKNTIPTLWMVTHNKSFVPPNDHRTVVVEGV